VPNHAAPMRKRYGRLAVIGESTWRHASIGGKTYSCQCDCGNVIIVLGKWLRHGVKKSCGCLRRDQLRKAGKDHPGFKHGHTPRGRPRSKTYNSYQAMIARCYLESNISYVSYGAKGVRVCARWRGRRGFINFLADMGERPEGKTIDRKNPFKNYSPSNCKWSTRAEQDRNKCADWVEDDVVF
jgi:hypothetical protein